MKIHKLKNDNTKYTLGLATMGNSSACIFKGNELLVAIEEERITRIKNDGGFPIESIKECLNILGISIEDISDICVYWRPLQVSNRILGSLKKIIFSGNFYKSISFIFNRVSSIFLNKKNKSYSEDRGSWVDLFFIKKIVKKNIGNFHGKIFFLDHHLTHQAYAAAIENWNNSIILSYDGGGESHSTVISVNVNNKLIYFHKISRSSQDLKRFHEISWSSGVWGQQAWGARWHRGPAPIETFARSQLAVSSIFSWLLFYRCS